MTMTTTNIIIILTLIVAKGERERGSNTDEGEESFNEDLFSRCLYCEYCTHCTDCFRCRRDSGLTKRNEGDTQLIVRRKRESQDILTRVLSLGFHSSFTHGCCMDSAKEERLRPERLRGCKRLQCTLFPLLNTTHI